MLNARAGRPYSFDLSGGPRLPGGQESLNGSGGALYLPTVGRNTLRLPASVNLDLRANRNLRLTRGLELRFSVEAFNPVEPSQSVFRDAAGVSGRHGGFGSYARWSFRSAAAIARRGAEHASLRHAYGCILQPGPRAPGAAWSEASVLIAEKRAGKMIFPARLLIALLDYFG